MMNDRIFGFVSFGKEGGVWNDRLYFDDVRLR